MQRVVIGALSGALIGGVALAQFSNPGGGVSSDQLNAAISTLQATVMAAIPTPMGAVPPQPNGAGVVGVANSFFPADGAQRQTVQRTTVTTDVNGNWSVGWATAFQSVTPTVNPIPLNPTAAAPYTCNVLTRSANTATGKCWQTASAANGLLGITISLGSTSSPNSTSVMVIGAEPTQ